MDISPTNRGGAAAPTRIVPVFRYRTFAIFGYGAPFVNYAVEAALVQTDEGWHYLIYLMVVGVFWLCAVGAALFLANSIPEPPESQYASIPNSVV